MIRLFTGSNGVISSPFTFPIATPACVGDGIVPVATPVPVVTPVVTPAATPANHAAVLPVALPAKNDPAEPTVVGVEKGG
jgi:hypothetical protein